MEPKAIDDVRQRLDDEDEQFVEFLRRDTMSLELYRLQAGATDPQDPHTEDEVYYVVSGSAKIRIGDDEHPVEAGDVVFVERDVEHSFFDIEEDLVTLIVFAPPYGSLADDRP
jgi:mannose-1-phosphate guanylyltransferase